MSEPLRFASWNVNSLNVRLPQVLEWLERRQPDCIGLQETKLVDEKFPAAAFEAIGYRSVFAGQRTYNGAAMLVKEAAFSIREPMLGIPGYVDEQKRFVGAVLEPKDGGEPIRFLSAYVPNGMAAGSFKYLYKLDWLAALRRAAKSMLDETPRLVLGGDFNIAPADADIWNPGAWEEKSPCTTPEREALKSLLSLGLSDSYRLFAQRPMTFSWWDYRQNGFERNQGMRIDLLLVSDALKPRVTAAAIDAEPRGWAQPSDHAPVLVSLR